MSFTLNACWSLRFVDLVSRCDANSFALEYIISQADRTAHLGNDRTAINGMLDVEA